MAGGVDVIDGAIARRTLPAVAAHPIMAVGVPLPEGLPVRRCRGPCVVDIIVVAVGIAIMITVWTILLKGLLLRILLLVVVLLRILHLMVRILHLHLLLLGLHVPVLLELVLGHHYTFDYTTYGVLEIC